jgi:hypothetical protein
MNNSLFLYRDDNEGKIGIGKLPYHLRQLLEDIRNEYYQKIPDINLSTYHTWYDSMSPKIKEKVNKLQNDPFWIQLCDKSQKCTRMSVKEMDELYYSNPKNNLKNINLYGASSNYDIHKDCIYDFNGIRFYRILIGLTDGNDNIKTYFNKFNVGHKINTGDYIVFDFDKTTHQVIKEQDGSTPRIMLKLHYIVCENCEYSRNYIKIIKQFYIIYEYITRYIMKTGTDPQTFYEFFIGLSCQYLYTKNIEIYIIFILVFILIFLRYIIKIKFLYKNIWEIIKYTFGILITIYIIIVFFYWIRYQLFGIR